MNATLTKDLLLNMLLGLTALVIVLFLLPIAKPQDESSTAPGNMSIAVVWPEGADDVDLWVRGPGDNTAVGYSNKGGTLFNLLRDDLGVSGDSLPMNYENAFSRGLPDGEYVINLHCYTCGERVTVGVEVRITAETTKLVTAGAIELRPKQERTFVRLTVRDGAVVAQNTVFVPLRAAK